jgi:RNA polymerase sigma-70 factor, ECF subfamily
MRSAAEMERLVRAAQSGDVRAFETLVERQIPRIRRFARAFAPTDQDADDLAQEALIKVYRAFGHYRHQSELSTWLFAIIRNCFLDSLKSNVAHLRARQANWLATADRSQQANSADQLLERKQEQRRLWAALAALPAEFRTTLVLLDIEGLSHAEVAAIEGVPLGTVKSRQSRGRDHLRRLLTGDGRPTEGAAQPDSQDTVPVVSAPFWREKS